LNSIKKNEKNHYLDVDKENLNWKN